MNRSYPSIRTATVAAILVLSAITLILGAGCTARTQQVERISDLQPGKTTEQDASALLGSKPLSYSSRPDGTYVAMWQHVEVPFMARARTNRVSILFDRNNVMVKIVSMEQAVDNDKKITVK